MKITIAMRNRTGNGWRKLRTKQWEKSLKKTVCRSVFYMAQYMIIWPGDVLERKE